VTVTPEQAAFLKALVDAHLLTVTGVAGVYGRGADFERIRLAFDALVTRTAEIDEPEPLLFPPILLREHLETNGYLSSFPHLAGTVFGFEGSEQQAADLADAASRHEDWSQFEKMTDMVLAPAACYAIYPAVARRGPVPEAGLSFDTGDAYVFRHEPSDDPARLQIFHMREIVRVGAPDSVLEWRLAWRERAIELLRSLGLSVDLDIASDPFFGRTGRLMAAQQRDQELKWELVAPIAGNPTALGSSNYHQDHFGAPYDIRTESGEVAHTSCLGFGEERVTLSLFSAHGLDVQQWPETVRDRLAL